MLDPTYWVFDLDGTLTVPVHDFDAIRSRLGLEEGCDILAALSKMSETQALPLLKELELIEIELAKKALPSPGAVALLAELHQRNCELGILTRNNKKNALFSLEALGVGSYFSEDCVLGREDVAPKPSPDGILKLSAYWNTTPVNVMMVGDYLYDLQAGRNAGATTVHVDQTGVFPWPEWMDIGVNSLQKLHQGLCS